MLEIRENEPLKNHSTFRIGGPARFFCAAKSKEEILEAVDYAKKNNLPFYVLGGGSNILFKDEGFEGLVIKIQNTIYNIQDTKIEVGAGLMLGVAVNKAAEAGLSGLEWAVGIPGTIGGGISGNCGAYGKSLSEAVESVEVLVKEVESETWQVKTYSKDECGFVYRGSRFKPKALSTMLGQGNLARRVPSEIILNAVLKLEKGETGKIKEEMKKIIQSRTGKHPPFPSAGSYFKNIVLAEMTESDKEKLLSLIPPEQVKGGKVGTGFLIDQCGLRGTKIGGAQVSELHGNFLVNIGGATAQDVLAVAEVCKQKVREKFGIELEEETIIV